MISSLVHPPVWRRRSSVPWEALEAEAVDELLPLRLHEAVLSESFSPPLFAALCSANLLTALQQLSTDTRLVAPMRLDIAETPSSSSGAHEEFIGVQIRTGSGHAVVFTRNDAAKPFLSTDDAMGSSFEPELRKRLAERDASASTAERVRATLLEALPGGSGATDVVARRP